MAQPPNSDRLAGLAFTRGSRVLSPLNLTDWLTIDRDQKLTIDERKLEDFILELLARKGLL